MMKRLWSWLLRRHVSLAEPDDTDYQVEAWFANVDDNY